ncbi:hypothetical protein MF271_07505 [Deinococcus sp. KNUC1210]|uniref:hypothetical protein n=1 Tax=Deinococcus sp. KNUC1210 TaxID=2917691 RepID=UPI001EF1361D|nr:hypothetical protein [Deinococcus sp. KNUC1210]ULH16422.1 hypothetical protein MF271_07505 [Deinococcus sp. KNUC1210]
MEIRLTQEQWEQFQAGLYERDERLERREPGGTYSRDERVDAYVLSAHAEALYSQDIDPDLWETLADLEMEAGSDEEAWRMIREFYLERGCVLVRIGEDLNTDAGPDDREEWLFSERLAERLGLTAGL